MFDKGQKNFAVELLLLRKESSLLNCHSMSAPAPTPIPTRGSPATPSSSTEPSTSKLETQALLQFVLDVHYDLGFSTDGESAYRAALALRLRKEKFLVKEEFALHVFTGPPDQAPEALTFQTSSSFSLRDQGESLEDVFDRKLTIASPRQVNCKKCCADILVFNSQREVQYIIEVKFGQTLTQAHAAQALAYLKHLIRKQDVHVSKDVEIFLVLFYKPVSSKSEALVSNFYDCKSIEKWILEWCEEDDVVKIGNLQSFIEKARQIIKCPPINSS